MGRPIFRLKLDGTIDKKYDSIMEASRDVKLDESSIRKATDKENRSCGGFIWRSHTSFKHIDIESRILILDIETAPIKAYTWGLWNQDIYTERIIEDWFILCFSAKWLTEDFVISGLLTPEELINEDDTSLVVKVRDLLDEADIVITHNGKRFDVPRINTRLLLNNVSPPTPYKQIDTREIAKKEFGFSSNKMDYIAKLLDIPQKIETNFELWRRCSTGDYQALLEMSAYCNNDIRMLEEIYMRLRPYIKGHPNLNLYSDESLSCPTCGSKNIKVEPDKYFYTQAVKYRMYKCADCNSYSRSKHAQKIQNKKTISAIPR